MDRRQSDEIEITLDSLIYGGDALGRLPDGRLVFVPYALPGETVTVRLTEEKRRHARAELMEVLTPSPERVAPRCRHFGVCGGCHYQHLDYAAQLAAKQAILKEQLQRIAGIQDPPLRAPVSSPWAWGYRNHVQFHLTSSGALGYQMARSDKAFPIQECHLPEEPLNAVWPQLEFEPLPGLERIGLRAGAGDEIQLILESSQPDPPEISVEDLPLSVVHTSPWGTLVLAGSEYVEIEVLGRSLRVSAGAFFQANRQIARFRKPPSPSEEARPVEKVATPGAATIDQLTGFLNVPRSKTAKAVFMMAAINGTEQFVCAIVRGDMEVNETKLANAIEAAGLRPAREDEIIAAGGVPGYASPIGLRGLVVVYDTIPQSPNLVAGANNAGYHLLNTNYGRDYKANIEVDIAAAGEGAACPQCGSPMHAERGVEVGNIFKLGTRYSDALGCTFLDKDGKHKPVIMGSYGIGIGRLLACVAEAHNDQYGLIWPISIAPYHVHLICLPDDGAAEVANKLYDDLWAASVEVLCDDRDERPGVKFTDADLIGLPLRLTVSGRSLAAGGVEFKRRDQPEKTIVPMDEVMSRVREEINRLYNEIAAKGIEAQFG